MRDTFFLRLTSAAPDARVSYRVDTPELLGRTVVDAPLADALAAAHGKRLIAIVPSTDVRLASVTVPVRQTSRVLQAVPYALEDKLAEDVDALHFALGPRQADGSHPVAIVARQTVDGWLQPLRDAGLRPESVFPDLLCLPPPEPSGWSVLAEDTADGLRFICRTGTYAGFSCSAGDLETYIGLADPDGAVRLRVLLTRQVQADLTRLPRPTDLLPGYETALDALARHIDPARAIDLLQGAYSFRQDLQRSWRPWRLPAALAASWLVATLASAAIDGARLDREHARLQAANEARFHELFPGEARIVDMSAQAEQQLKILTGQSAQQSFLPLMEKFAAGMAERPGLTLQNLQYREGALFVSLTGKDVQALENLRGWFQSQSGIAFEVQGENSTAEGVQVRLKLALAS